LKWGKRPILVEQTLNRFKKKVRQKSAYDEDKVDLQKVENKSERKAGKGKDSNVPTAS